MNRQTWRVVELPSHEDGIPDRMCLRCGFRGPHPHVADCIGRLRDKIADLEFELSAVRKAAPKRQTEAART